eukprot:3071428-Rhodomonas_salina.3
MAQRGASRCEPDGEELDAVRAPRKGVLHPQHLPDLPHYARGPRADAKWHWQTGPGTYEEVVRTKLKWTGPKKRDGKEGDLITVNGGSNPVSVADIGSSRPGSRVQGPGSRV